VVPGISVTEGFSPETDELVKKTAGNRLLLRRSAGRGALVRKLTPGKTKKEGYGVLIVSTKGRRV